MLDRNPNDCADFGRREQLGGSSTVKDNFAFGQPVLSTTRFYELSNEFRARRASAAPAQRGSRR